ncbi:hypothetical protein ACFY0R_02415 [Streptomyces sp. NPDC001633]|uniref:hypothetical protein n=1 Tax=Streptomyces sp. NPDC001633 TaxID=3364595 RepID=UPI0036CFABC0
MVPLACSLVGHEGTIELVAGSLVEQLMGAERSIERYHCNFGASPHYVKLLRDQGLHFTGVDSEGEVRIAELPGHPFFLATLFQKEAGPARVVRIGVASWPAWPNRWIPRSLIPN